MVWIYRLSKAYTEQSVSWNKGQGKTFRYMIFLLCWDKIHLRIIREVKIMIVGNEEYSLGLKVDHVDGVVSVSNEQIKWLSPIFKGPSLNCFPRVLKQNNHLILLLNPKGIESLNMEDRTPDAETLCPELRPPSIQEECEFMEADSLETRPDADIKSPSPLAENDLQLLFKQHIDSEKLESFLTQMIDEETISDMIMRISARILEESITCEIGKVGEILRKRMAEKSLKNANK